MLIKKLGAVVLVGVLLTGCGSKLSKEEIAEYHRMKALVDSISVDVEYQRYEEAVLFLVNPESVNKEYVEKEKWKYAEVLSEKAIQALLNSAYEEEEYDEDEHMDVGIEYDEEFEGEGAEEGENGLYPIYDQFYSVVDYGTEEEMNESIEAFLSIPVNTIKGITVYPDVIVVRILNKFTGEYAVSLKLKEGKIDEYETFR